jgi:ABC-type Na+ efflux pump permease subunit
MSTPLFDRVRAAAPEAHARRLAPAGAALCLAGSALANALGVALALAGLALLLASCLSRDDGLLILGPFSRYELRRLAHHRRPPAFWRAVYAGAIFLILMGNVWSYIPHALEPNAKLSSTDAARLRYIGMQVFNWIAVLQFLFLAYATVSLFAPLVAEEREAKRLEFLLITDLRNREILIGKALGRAPQLLDPILASLPVLAVLPMLGGVPPAFVFAAAGATLATVLGLAGVSFFCSITVPTGRLAVRTAWAFVFIYLIGSSVVWGLALKPEVWTFPSSLGFQSPVALGDVAKVASAGNPVVALIRIEVERPLGADVETRVLAAAWSYTLFHFAAVAVFGLLAVSRLRSWKVNDPNPRPLVIGKSIAPDKLVRPPVTDDAVTWHELYRETKLRTLPNQRTVLRALFVTGVSFTLTGHAIQALYGEPMEKWANVVVGMVAWGLGLVVLLAASGRAATTVAREREKDTLEALMLTGLGCREILRQKWRGCVGALVPVYVVLLGTLAAAVVTLAIHPLAAVLVAITIPVHAGFAASLGLSFSVQAKNATRAVWTMWVTVLGVAWVASIPVVAMFQALGEPQFLPGPVAVLLIPPAAVGAELVAFESLPSLRPWEGPLLAAVAAAGTALYAWLGYLLWRAAVRMFEREWETRR